MNPQPVPAPPLGTHAGAGERHLERMTAVQAPRRDQGVTAMLCSKCRKRWDGEWAEGAGALKEGELHSEMKANWKLDMRGLRCCDRKSESECEFTKSSWHGTAAFFSSFALRRTLLR